MSNLNFISDNVDIISPVTVVLLFISVVLFAYFGRHYPKVFIGLFGSLAVVNFIALMLFRINDEHDNFKDKSKKRMFVGSTLTVSMISVLIVYLTIFRKPNY